MKHKKLVKKHHKYHRKLEGSLVYQNDTLRWKLDELASEVCNREADIRCKISELQDAIKDLRDGDDTILNTLLSHEKFHSQVKETLGFLKAELAESEIRTNDRMTKLESELALMRLRGSITKGSYSKKNRKDKE